MVEQALRFPWPDAGRTSIQYNQGVHLVVFVRNGEVVGWFEHPRNRGDFSRELKLVGYSRAEAQFVVHSDAHQWPLLVAR